MKKIKAFIIALVIGVLTLGSFAGMADAKFDDAHEKLIEEILSQSGISQDDLELKEVLKILKEEKDEEKIIEKTLPLLLKNLANISRQEVKLEKVELPYATEGARGLLEEVLRDVGLEEITDNQKDKKILAVGQATNVSRTVYALQKYYAWEKEVAPQDTYEKISWPKKVKMSSGGNASGGETAASTESKEFAVDFSLRGKLGDFLKETFLAIGVEENSLSLNADEGKIAITGTAEQLVMAQRILDKTSRRLAEIEAANEGDTFLRKALPAGALGLTLALLLAGVALKKMAGKKTEDWQDDVEESLPDDKEMDGFAKECIGKALDDYTEINEVIARLSDESLRSQLKKLQGTAKKVIQYMAKHPERISLAERFVNYYQDRALAISKEFLEFEEMGIDMSKISDVRGKILSALEGFGEAYQAQLMLMANDKIMNVEAELKAAENIMAEFGIKTQDGKEA